MSTISTNERTIALRGVVQAAGIQGVVEEIPDQYWPETPAYDAVKSPWLRVHTHRGTIVIGWRKRVIAIDWSHGSFLTHGSVVVAKPENTHGERMCHAWGYQEAIECLQRLRELDARVDYFTAEGSNFHVGWDVSDGVATAFNELIVRRKGRRHCSVHVECLDCEELPDDDGTGSQDVYYVGFGEWKFHVTETDSDVHVHMEQAGPEFYQFGEAEFERGKVHGGLEERVAELLAENRELQNRALMADELRKRVAELEVACHEVPELVKRAQANGYAACEADAVAFLVERTTKGLTRARNAESAVMRLIRNGKHRGAAARSGE